MTCIMSIEQNCVKREHFNSNLCPMLCNVFNVLIEGLQSRVSDSCLTSIFDLNNPTNLIFLK